MVRHRPLNASCTFFASVAAPATECHRAARVQGAFTVSDDTFLRLQPVTTFQLWTHSNYQASVGWVSATALLKKRTIHRQGDVQYDTSHEVSERNDVSNQR
jgi:hypothetical protein